MEFFRAFWQWARRERFIAGVSFLAFLYVAAALSPSAYAIVLRSFGVANDGLLFGWPQWIRSDEYAVWTPTLQAVVANDFAPVNATSLYQEKFRTLSSMPIRDWGLAFKPEFWAFMVLSPARAYSAYHAFHGLAFLIGWSLLLRRLGVGRAEAALAALLLFGSGWAQIWWTSLAPVLAIAPFFALVALWPLRPLGRIVAGLYVTAVWLMDGLFYPPLVLALALSLGLALVAFRPEILRPRLLLEWAAGTLAGIAVAAFYLWQPILATAGSVVHGERNLGGGAVPWQDWLATFQPSFGYHGWDTTFGSNPCESSAAGSILWLLLLCFTEAQSWRALLAEAGGRRLLMRAGGLLALFTAVSVWMLAPVPAIWGEILLWHLTPPSRLLLLPGLLSLLFALLLLPRLTFRFSWRRAALFAALIALGFVYTERQWHAAEAASWARLVHAHIELVLLPLAFLAPLFELAWRRLESSEARWWRRPTAAELAQARALSPAALLLLAALFNLLTFAPFNPLQSARAIFARPDSAELRGLQAMQDAHPRGWLVAGGVNHFGSILNGLGFRSVNHALLNPEVEKFAEFFPRLSPDQLRQTFDRYANIQVSPYTPPNWKEPLEQPLVPVDNAVLVPPEAFLPPFPIKLRGRRPGPVLPRAEGASVRLLALQGRQVELEVLGPLRGLSGETSLALHADPPAARVLAAFRLPAYDQLETYGADHYSRLFLRVALQEIPVGEPGFCVTLKDPVHGDRNIAPLPDAGRSTCP